MRREKKSKVAESKAEETEDRAELEAKSHREETLQGGTELGPGSCML
jgi:hypothetical protein